MFPVLDHFLSRPVTNFISQKNTATFLKNFIYVAEKLSTNFKYDLKSFKIKIVKKFEDFEEQKITIEMFSFNDKRNIAEISKNRGDQIEYYKFCEEIVKQIENIENIQNNETFSV